MPLTLRTNGSATANIITASWFNDYYNLFTGSMQDQIVTIKNELVLNAIGAAPTVACAGSLAGGTNLGIGVYNYVYTYANANGESAISPNFQITTTSGNQSVSLTGITVGPTGTTKRNVYRSVVGGGGTPTQYKFLTALNDNTTTTFSDTIADGSLGATTTRVTPTFGGAMTLNDATAIARLILGNDGTINQNLAPVTVNGSVSGSVSLWQPLTGSVKMVFAQWNAWRSTTNGFLTLPVPFTTFSWGFAGLIGVSGDGGMILFNRNAATNVSVINSLAAGGGGANSQQGIFSVSFWHSNGAFDQIEAASNSTAKTGYVIIIGQ